MDAVDTAVNDDSAKKYQEILDKYAHELDSNTMPEEVAPTITTPLEQTPPAMIEVPVPKITPPTPILEPPSPPAPIASKPAPSGLNIFKYLFFVSLIIFMGVTGLFVKTTLKLQMSLPFTPSPTPTIVLAPSPVASVTPDMAVSCELDGKKYAVGETFRSSDGCNTCSCSPQLTVNCTLMACSVTPPAFSASPSATIPKTWKSFTDSKLAISFKYPPTYSVKNGAVCPPQNEMFPCLYVTKETSDLVSYSASISAQLSPQARNVKSSAVINTISAIKFTVTEPISEGSNDQTYLYFIDKHISIRYPTSPTFEQILSTLKFTK